MTDKISAMLGLARRAGKLVMGCENIVKAGTKCKIIIVASDAAERTKKTIARLEIKTVYSEYTKARLGELLGAEEVAAAAVTDKNFALIADKEF